MWGYGYAPYETVEEKQEKAQAMIQRLQKKGQTLSPIPSGIKLGATWWGRAWNQNLERYADYSNRLGRGKTYVRNGFVIDLYMEKGEVSALVAGSSKSPYHVEIIIDPIKPSAWKTIKETVGRRIDSVEALVAGSFPKELGDVLFGSLFQPRRRSTSPAPVRMARGCANMWPPSCTAWEPNWIRIPVCSSRFVTLIRMI
jgi:hypothetical protein